MLTIEIACALILALHAAVGLKVTTDRAAFLRRFLLVAGASWIGEDTCIRAYGFYAYDAGWGLFLDRMPLMIAAIWPAVILSSWEVAKHLVPSTHRRLATRPLLVGALVFADAWLIEPIAVQTGLWRWFEPGLFNVPIIGVAGWAYFAMLAVAVLEWVERAQEPAVYEAAILLVAPLGAHVLLVATWWALFRWITVPIPSWPAVALGFAVSLGLAGWAAMAGARKRMPPAAIFSRMPPAIFFFVLLAVFGRAVPALVVWAVAFAPPWLALTPWNALRRKESSRTQTGRNLRQ